MDKIDPARALLSAIAQAVRVCQRTPNVPKEWLVETDFCFRLSATLEGVRDCSPIKGNYTYTPELNRFIEAVLQPLSYFYKDLAPGLSNLQKGSAPGASPAVLSQLEGQLGVSVIPRTKTLREQVYRYLQSIDTLLLLYVINITASQSNVLLSDKRLHDLNNLTRRAQVGASQGLDQLTRQFSAKALRIEEQQRCLMSMRQDVENHWAGLQASANRVSNDPGKTGNKTGAVQSRPPQGQPATRPATQNPVPQPVPPVQAPAHTSRTSTPKGSRPAQPHAGAYPGPGALTTNIVNVGVQGAGYSSAKISQPAQQPRPGPAPGSGAPPPGTKSPGPKRKQVAPPSAPPPVALTPGGKRKPAAPASSQPRPQNQHGPASQPGHTSKPPQKTSKPQGKPKPGHTQARQPSSSRSGGGGHQNQSSGNVNYQSTTYNSENNYSNYENTNLHSSNYQQWNYEYNERPESPASSSGRHSSESDNRRRSSESDQPENLRRSSDSYQRPNQQDTNYDPRWANQDESAYRQQDAYQRQDTNQGWDNHQGQNANHGWDNNYQEQLAYPGQDTYPGQQSHNAYELQDMDRGSSQPYTSPQPPAYQDQRDDIGYSQPAPMRTSADSARSRSNAGKVAAVVGGAAVLGGAAAVATAGSETGEGEGCCDDGCCDCCDGGCCEGGCCEGGCCEGGCCEGGCCEGGACCEDGCCEGGCCDGGGCCGDQDPNGNGSGCCIIM